MENVQDCGDAADVLTKHSGTEEVEGLVLKLPRCNKVSFSAKAFTKMQRLRLLQLYYVQLTGVHQCFPEELRWLCWHGFPLRFIPKDFRIQNLVALDLTYSNLCQVWKDPPLLEKLKFLDLSNSHYLTLSPDFSKLPNLQQLMLKGCVSLPEVHESIGHLGRLSVIDFGRLQTAQGSPRSLYKSKSIEVLVLSGCSRFENFAEDLWEMVSLTTLLADRTAIRKVPFTIVRLKNLRNSSLCDWKWSPSMRFGLCFGHGYFHDLLLPSLQGLNCLEKLSLANCNLTDGAIPNGIWRIIAQAFAPSQIYQRICANCWQITALHWKDCQIFQKYQDDVLILHIASTNLAPLGMETGSWIWSYCQCKGYSPTSGVTLSLLRCLKLFVLPMSSLFVSLNVLIVSRNL
ncbi:unnamed protein product [Prunus armeniaca]